jgi:hypothetical protein
MSTLHHLGILSALVFGIAAGCSDDDVSPDPNGDAGAAGESTLGGAPDAAAGTSTTPAGGGAGGLGGASTGGAGADASGAGGSAETGGAGAGGSGGEAGEAGGAGGSGGEGGAIDPLATSTVVDVNDVKTNPEPYAWFDFRPNVKKLILAGAAETEHIAILWYTVTDGGVGLHYHSKTESVYVIDGTQTDAKGVYTDGTVYFNPPGSGHQITNSSGFFILAYAAPPDFMNTDLIEEYEPVRIDTTDAGLTTTYDFTEKAAGIQSYTVPLEELGGLGAEIFETSSAESYAYEGNYLLVLKGSCDIEGVTLAPGMLVVAKTVVPQAYAVSATVGSTCLAMGVSF